MTTVLPEKGDGSASVPGKSPATAQSAAGALIEAKPEYFKNPPPKYPYLAKQKGWEGTVLLNVDVDKAGKPLRITLEQSSGHQVLDDAAFKALKKWQFRPALLGDIPVDSTVRVPVRFVLQ